MSYISNPQEQLGICAEGNLHSAYLMFMAKAGQEEALRSALANVAQYIHESTATYSESAFSGFIAVGANYWDTLYPSQRPALLRPFPALTDGNRHAPASEFDIFIHLRCDRLDVIHFIANAINDQLEAFAELTEEERGFRFFDSRDLTGFVDGTENPQNEDRQAVALVGTDDPAFTGGSYIHVQKYLHKLKKWNRLPVNKQEDIVGRTKEDDIEYESDAKPLTAHIKRVNLKYENGDSMEILRQSMPFGDVKQQGLMFISTCFTPVHFEKMLESMIVNDEAGNHDHLLHFTQAVTGASFFAPSLSFMLQFKA